MIYVVLLLALLVLAVVWWFRMGPGEATEAAPGNLLSEPVLRSAFGMSLAEWQAHVGAQGDSDRAWRGNASAIGDTLMERTDPGTVVATRPVFERSTDRPDALVVVIVSRPKPEGVDGAVAAEAIRRTTAAMLPRYIVTGTQVEGEEQITVELMVTEERSSADP